MRKLISILFLALGTGSLSFAQNGFGPAAGDISVSMQLGRAESFDNLQYVRSPVNSNYYNGDYYLNTPFATTVSTSSNSLVNMIGVEAKYFVTDQIAVRLSGMGMIDLTPAQDAVPGLNLYDLVDYNTQQKLQEAGVDNVVLPSYREIESTTTHRFVANVGGDYYFSVGSQRVFPYAGAMASFNYGRHQFYAPDSDPTTAAGVELSSRFFETFGLGGSLVGGVDYYVAEGMFIGFEIKAFNYLYSVNKMMPMAGVEAYDADNHTIGILSNPMFKIGFKF
ncbi:putative OmpA-OmpF-like porin [Breznakibacter xylanolyticus]|uniref:Putative OmpA-OmpF-like porin n=1 Tax=Breznakibacter xylanolyticus TaxID=990 RepID=A0A2W7NCD6_9BACT|nr:BT1926 family outer membrane beta-barrel protein [Breznakibacter xylanolyticus]PZX18041.1 putative OmpA-OmpF-like porin [Breznakibacter xylanolyticus]